MFATAPGTELVVTATVAARPAPVYVFGELFTASVAVGVALLIWIVAGGAAACACL